MSEIEEAREAYAVLKAEADKLRGLAEPIRKELEDTAREMIPLYEKRDKASKKRLDELWEKKGNISLQLSQILYRVGQYETAADNARKIFDKSYAKKRREEEIRKIHSL